MPKRVPLDTSLFKVNLPPPTPVRRDPLDSLIPSAPPNVSQGANVANHQTPPSQVSSVAIPTPSETTIFEPNSDRSTERPDDRSTGKSRRTIIRTAFDIYSDQLISLQRLQLVAITAGRKKPKMGAMVRSALERFIAAENKKYGNQ